MPRRVETRPSFDFDQRRLPYEEERIHQRKVMARIVLTEEAMSSPVNEGAFMRFAREAQAELERDIVAWIPFQTRMIVDMPSQCARWEGIS